MELQNCGEKDQTKNVNVPMEQEQSPLQQNLEEKGDFQRIFFIHLLFSENPGRRGSFGPLPMESDAF